MPADIEVEVKVEVEVGVQTLAGPARRSSDGG